MRTQVAIIGAGPAGLLLSHLLDLDGIDSVLIERQSAGHVASRIRAGILESSTVDVLTRAGLADRLATDSLEHHGIYLQWPGRRVHIDFTELAGRSVFGLRPDRTHPGPDGRPREGGQARILPG